MSNWDWLLLPSVEISCPVKNEFLLWERGPEEYSLFVDCPFLKGSFFGAVLVVRRYVFATHFGFVSRSPVHGKARLHGDSTLGENGQLSVSHWNVEPFGEAEEPLAVQ